MGDSKASTTLKSRTLAPSPRARRWGGASLGLDFSGIKHSYFEQLYFQGFGANAYANGCDAGGSVCYPTVASQSGGFSESGNTVTANVQTAPLVAFAAGQWAVIKGFSGTDAGYNCTCQITSVSSATQFQYYDPTAGLSPSTTNGTVANSGNSGSYINNWKHVYIQPGGGNVGLEIRNASHTNFFDHLMTIGGGIGAMVGDNTTTDVVVPVDVQFVASEFDSASSVGFLNMRSSSLMMTGGYFEFNHSPLNPTNGATAVALKVAWDSQVYATTIDGPYLAVAPASNDVKMSLGSPTVTFSSSGNGDARISSNWGISSQPGVNLFPNALLEGWASSSGNGSLFGWSQSSAANWGPHGGGLYTASTTVTQSTVAHTGSFAAQGSDGTNSNTGLAITNWINVNPAFPYTLTFWVRADAGTPSLIYDLRACDQPNGAGCNVTSGGSVIEPLVTLNPSWTTTVPGLSVGGSGGTIPTGTVYLKLTQVNGNGETTASAEASIAITLGQQLTVTAPAALAGNDSTQNATGYCIYASESPGQEVLQSACPLIAQGNLALRSLSAFGPSPPATDGSGIIIGQFINPGGSGPGGNGGIGANNIPWGGQFAFASPAIALGGAYQQTIEVMRLPALTQSILVNFRNTTNTDHFLLDDMQLCQGQCSSLPVAAPLGDSDMGGVVTLKSMLQLPAATATVNPGTIAAGSCANPVTVALTGVTASSVSSVSPAAALPASWNSATYYSYPTVGNVNIVVCNPTSANINPDAVTFNVRAVN